MLIETLSPSIAGRSTDVSSENCRRKRSIWASISSSLASGLGSSMRRVP